MNRRDVEQLNINIAAIRAGADAAIAIVGPLLSPPAPPDAIGQALAELDTAVHNLDAPDGSTTLAAAQVRRAVSMLRRFESDVEDLRGRFSIGWTHSTKLEADGFAQPSVRQLERAVLQAAAGVRDGRFSVASQLTAADRSLFALGHDGPVGQVVAKDTGPRFRPGDVVKLRSGGPRMTVENFLDDKVDVVWFSPCGIDGELHQSKFAPELVVLVAAAGTEPK